VCVNVVPIVQHLRVARSVQISKSGNAVSRTLQPCRLGHITGHANINVATPNFIIPSSFLLPPCPSLLYWARARTRTLFTDSMAAKVDAGTTSAKPVVVDEFRPLHHECECRAGGGGSTQTTEPGKLICHRGATDSVCIEGDSEKMAIAGTEASVSSRH